MPFCMLQPTNAPRSSPADMLQMFEHIPRDRLTTLAVFCRSLTVPVGTVLATQSEYAEHVFLIVKGEVDLILEGAHSSNPMAPRARRNSEMVPGMSYLAAGSAAAVKASLTKQPSMRSTAEGEAAQSRCATLHARLSADCT